MTTTSATPSGTVQPHGLPTTYRFVISPDPSFPAFLQASGSAGTGSTAVPVSATFATLTPGTLHY